MPGLYLPDLSNIITVLDRYMEPSVRLARNKIGGETTVRGGIDNIEFFVFLRPRRMSRGKQMDRRLRNSRFRNPLYCTVKNKLTERVLHCGDLLSHSPEPNSVRANSSILLM